MIKKKDPMVPVIMITAYSDVAVAVESLKSGAKEFIQKERVKPEDYVGIIKRSMEEFYKETIHLPIDVKRELSEQELYFIERALRRIPKKTEVWKYLGYSSRFAMRRRVLRIFEKYPELKKKFPSLYKRFKKS